MSKRASRVIKKIVELIYNKEYAQESRMKDEQFTRKRKLPFTRCMVLIMNRLTISLQIELANLFDRFEEWGEEPTQQAFSKARKQIKPEAFQTLGKAVRDDILEHDRLRRYRGYRIFAIDGSDIVLPSSTELWEAYPNTEKEVYRYPHARISMLCEVLDGYIMEGEISGRGESERKLATKHIRAFTDKLDEKDLLILDRGYPSHEMLWQLQEGKSKYLMRVPKNFNPQIDQTEGQDFHVTLWYESNKLDVRVVRVILPTGETETLLTDLPEQDMPTEAFKELYALRWGVEGAYNKLKTRLQLEKFSGRSTIAVRQEFYATLLLMNIAATIARDANEAIQEKQEKATTKERKYSYVVNYNLLYGSLKRFLPRILFAENDESREAFIDCLMKACTKKPCPVRPGRSFPRPSRAKYLHAPTSRAAF